MNKNLIYGLVAGGLVLVLVGGYFFWPKTTQPQIASVPVEIPTAQETIVEKVDNGFFPETVTIKKSTAVKFVNKSSTPMWIASAPHPIHTDYPEFNQKENGDTFIFTFDKVGSWKYHNHSPFSAGGVVVVTE